MAQTENWRRIDANAFACMVDEPPDRLPDACRAAIAQHDLSYRLLEGRELEETIVAVLRDIDAGNWSVSGPDRLPAWERGWQENLDEFEKSGGDPKALIPGYYRRGVPLMRLFGRYVLPKHASFETDVLAVLQAYFAQTYLKDADAVFEFGCGPGHNLVAFERYLPGRKFVGLDWAAPSQALIGRIRQVRGIDVTGHRFDMFQPDVAIRPIGRSVYMTIGAMEQLGVNFRPFADYLLNSGADLYVHLEPLAELFDPGTILGYVASKWVEKRGYMNGYVDHLRSLEAQGTIRIDKLCKVIGNRFNDSWNLLVWRKT